VEAILGTLAVLEAKILANPMPASISWSATYPGFFYCHFVLFMYYIQHCFISCPSDFTVSENAGIEPMDYFDFGIGSLALLRFG
jgi:hypothetical protein